MMAYPVVIAITGGIGSGKSVVSHIVSAMGYKVYDCDAHAKDLMDGSDEIKKSISTEIDRLSITPDGKIDRRRLADVVFADPEKLRILNAIVHSAVRDDIASAIKACRDRIFFFETAILYESELDMMADHVWIVNAPEDIRVERVVKRNNCHPSQVRARIESQNASAHTRIHPSISMIENNGVLPILPRIEYLIESLHDS